ncbi:MAG: hypothetical protein F4X82_02000 [Candidatus Spechtbacteria bacterium SB0662_bin_43]|uniref:Uncharacterized protein n=1 Tax=Candidatus Spechtbacteria bacterium SB0662_bin_43 TaxID=2604897 RepID=A0A845D972_9BACT|nr:hypothetical protein [Candidatus Spechtbacteria bacterium SB0662_bin_43]
MSIFSTLRQLAQGCAEEYQELERRQFTSFYADEVWAFIRTSLKQRSEAAANILVARRKERQEWRNVSNRRSDHGNFFLWDAKAMDYALGELYCAVISYDPSQRPIGVAGEWVRGIAENVSYTSRDELLYAVFGGVAELAEFDPQGFEWMIESLNKPEARSLIHITSPWGTWFMAGEVIFKSWARLQQGRVPRITQGQESVR